MNLDATEIFSSFRQFELISRTLSNRVLSGMHASRTKQSDREFNNYRAYQYGDDLRFIDWKLFGKTEKLFIRENVSFKQSKIHVLIDASLSMNHKEDAFSKLEWAKLFTAVIAQKAHQQSDVFSLLNNSSAIRGSAPQRTLGLHRQLEAIFNIRAKENWTLFDTEAPRKIEGTLLALSDFHDTDLENKLLSLLNPQLDSNLVRLMGPLELGIREFDISSVRDLESKENGFIDSSDPIAFKDLVDRKIRDHRRKWATKNCIYDLINTDEIFAESLSNWWLKRSNLL